MRLKCFESTDSNGTEHYLIPLGDGSFVAVPKEQIEYKQKGKRITEVLEVGADDE